MYICRSKEKHLTHNVSSKSQCMHGVHISNSKHRLGLQNRQISSMGIHCHRRRTHGQQGATSSRRRISESSHFVPISPYYHPYPSPCLPCGNWFPDLILNRTLPGADELSNLNRSWLPCRLSSPRFSSSEIYMCKCSNLDDQSRPHVRGHMHSGIHSSSQLPFIRIIFTST